jgi:hypothetical protein
MSSPELIAKIRKVAEDLRGEPAIRKVARLKLESFQKTHPHLFEPPKPWAPPPRSPQPKSPQNSGMRPSPQWQAYVYFDMSRWKETSSGNLSAVASANGVAYRMILFRYKTTGEWGWIRFTVGEGPESKLFSPNRYATREEAHKDSWAHLQSLSPT